MKYQSKPFSFREKVTVEDVGGGIMRQIMGYEDSLMLCRVDFEQGSIGYTHSHPHAQLAYVESGVFEFTIGDETATLKKGDCAYIPSNVEHGALMTVPGLIVPGHLTIIGTLKPPSQVVPFSPRKGVVPPSGQVNFSAPLSVEYIITVLS